MKHSIFVDGQEGTTGLKLYEYLSKIHNIEIIKIDSDKKKDPLVRKKILNEADLVFLCLPDEASRESVSMINNKQTKIIDASTAFRIDKEWIYGLPELEKSQRERIYNSKRVSVPGCHATGFILAIRPLISAGILPKNYPISCFSITGYSGGGKKLISEYENSHKEQLRSPRQYALKLNHKHLPEMQVYSGLTSPPIFTPIVANYHQGLALSVPLYPKLFNKNISPSEIQELLATYYKNEPFVRVLPYESDVFLDEGYFNIMECNKTNNVDIFVFGHKDQVVIVTRLDNLGKGASGAAIQNMNIMLGLNESSGL
ncbi:N-acetyl-gamma-glutamyl-phosphate reductase [Paenibacillus pabuli]|uniref:N-acetyl-gamma-glutamyl-phosphate reductase n=1 Tax=Paenibacillus pabuli TaxID=1472 RepID=A0ABX9BER6_9BACL|nr:N-acetyl-gamma-glutamyl-phosphate reductase [Paenibacillus pabuli]RAI89550.1 N-acetyl-gamma-glutamyl-phosphate reductase [Paenibacillus pabuli]